MRSSIKVLKRLPADAKPMPGTKLTTKGGTTLERWTDGSKFFEVVTYSAKLETIYELPGGA